MQSKLTVAMDETAEYIVITKEISGEDCVADRALATRMNILITRQRIGRFELTTIALLAA